MDIAYYKLIPDLQVNSLVIHRRRRRHEAGDIGLAGVCLSVCASVRLSVALCCVRDNSFNSSPIATKLHICTSIDIVSVKFDKQRFPRILIR
jgi:hypothetical protein